MLLDVLGKFHTFQTFDDSPAKRPELVRTLHGTLTEHYDELSRLNKLGAGVFFTINETDGKGRKNENIVRVRALFADFDEPDKDRMRLFLDMGRKGPSCVVESSPGKHHAYWLMDDQGVSRDQTPADLAEFTPAQKLLAYCFGSDPKICDLARVMRVPGFYHNKGAPFLVREIYPQGAE